MYSPMQLHHLLPSFQPCIPQGLPRVQLTRRSILVRVTNQTYTHKGSEITAIQYDDEDTLRILAMGSECRCCLDLAEVRTP